MILFLKKNFNNERNYRKMEHAGIFFTFMSPAILMVLFAIMGFIDEQKSVQRANKKRRSSTSFSRSVESYNIKNRQTQFSDIIEQSQIGERTPIEDKIVSISKYEISFDYPDKSVRSSKADEVKKTA